MTPILFLDIDGVLNAHRFMLEAQSCNICRPCIIQFNRIIKATECHVVLSSAWRYMVTGRKPPMTLTGFGYMLRTHGALGSRQWLIGNTRRDEDCPHCGYAHRFVRGKVECAFNAANNRVCVKCGGQSTRGLQISAWLKANPGERRYVVLDDDDLDITAQGHPFVQTTADVGLNKRKANEVIRMLRGAK